MKILFIVFVLVVAAIAAGTYFQFNAVYLIFLILGFGLYMVTSSGGPQLPQDAVSSWSGPGRGNYFKVYFARNPATIAAARIPRKATAFASGKPC